MPKFIDAHAHVNFHAYDDDRNEVIRRSLESGVWMINVGTQQNTSQEAVELAKAYPEGVYAIVGLHPIHTSASYHDKEELGEEGQSFTSRGEVFDVDFYKGLLKHECVVGIGECGLDYFRTTPDSLEKQKNAFITQIELALEADVPLMIHTRPEKDGLQAYIDTLDILEGYAKTHGDKLRGDFHFFAGDTDIAKRILDIGFMCSFTGVLTFARSYDEVVKYLPLDRILVETDCPYVTPEPHRGKRNEPLYVKEVVRALSKIRSEDERVVGKQILENTIQLFGLTK